MAKQKKLQMAAVEVPAAGKVTAGAAPTAFGRLTRHGLLSAEEEADLSRRAQRGDRRAKNQLGEANMRLVINIAKQYHSSMIPFEDLVQEGSIGLITACERFDPNRGFRFSTYATHWVRQSISRAIDNKARSIRIPAHVLEMLRKIERARTALMREHGEEPTVEQIAEQLQVPARRVAAYLVAGQDPISLDMSVGEDENTPLANLIDDKDAAQPEEALIRDEVLREIRAIMDALTDRERMVMQRRLGFGDQEPQVLQEIGVELRISRERVRQIEAQALKHLRALATRRRLWEFLAD